MNAVDLAEGEEKWAEQWKQCKAIETTQVPTIIESTVSEAVGCR